LSYVFKEGKNLPIFPWVRRPPSTPWECKEILSFLENTTQIFLSLHGELGGSSTHVEYSNLN